MYSAGEKELKGINNIVEEERKAIPKLSAIVNEMENIFDEKGDNTMSEKTSTLKVAVTTMGDYLKHYFQYNLSMTSSCLDHCVQHCLRQSIYILAAIFPLGHCPNCYSKREQL